MIPKELGSLGGILLASSSPTHRLWRDHGLTLSAGTVAGGLKALTGAFLPVAEAIAQQQLTQNGWPVFVPVEGKRTALAFVGFCRPLAVVYQFQPQGSAQGTLLTDRYSAYKKLVRVSEGRICQGTFGEQNPPWQDWDVD